MKVGGQYVGLGLGDVSEEIRLIKDHMRRKFSYAKALADTQAFDDAMTTAVAEMQGRYNHDGKLAAGKYLPGIVNLETKYVMGYLQRPPGPDLRPVLFTVCGAGVPWWVGPDADTARALETKYRWQPIGYPAAAFPMGKSINEGKAELRRQFDIWRPTIEAFGCAMAIYSEGSLVGGEVYEHDVKPIEGAYHWVAPHLTKAVTWGCPMRELGKAWPDPGGQIAPANTSGVAYPDDRMKDTPEWWRNYAHKGDLYAACEQGDSGEDKTAIWRIVRGEKFFIGPDTLLEQFLEITQAPIPGAIGAFKAMMDAGMFFAKGLTPHTNYNIGPAIDYLRAA